MRAICWSADSRTVALTGCWHLQAFRKPQAPGSAFLHQLAVDEKAITRPGQAGRSSFRRTREIRALGMHWIQSVQCYAYVVRTQVQPARPHIHILSHRVTHVQEAWNWNWQPALLGPVEVDKLPPVLVCWIHIKLDANFAAWRQPWWHSRSDSQPDKVAEHALHVAPARRCFVMGHSYSCWSHAGLHQLVPPAVAHEQLLNYRRRVNRQDLSKDKHV